jgi:hypothetical protein
MKPFQGCELAVTRGFQGVVIGSADGQRSAYGLIARITE